MPEPRKPAIHPRLACPSPILGLILGLAFTAIGFAQDPVSGPMRIGVIVPDGGIGSGAASLSAVGELARMGATMAFEEFSHNAALLGAEMDVVTVTASGADEAVAQAERLVHEEGAFALVGGFGDEEAAALSSYAEDQGVLFLNIGSPSRSLRNEQCSRFTFHVEPSAAMYLDALVGWFVRAGFRDWSFVHEDTERGRAQLERARWAINERHFGAREVGAVAVATDDPDWQATVGELQRVNPGVVLLLLEPEQQLEFLSAAEEAGLEAEITGFPYPSAQIRSFYDASRRIAPRAGSGYRATSWEPTLESYGARELNARFLDRWGLPMDQPAWAAYVAVKILYEAAIFGQTLKGDELIVFLEGPAAVFDIWKGIGVSFRPWDHQLRQSLYLVDIDPMAQGDSALALLVGELPALYLPRTDPIERLDQLGDLANRSKCAF